MYFNFLIFNFILDSDKEDKEEEDKYDSKDSKTS